MEGNGRHERLDPLGRRRHNGRRRPRVVVGVADSPSSNAALAWAHDLCRERGWVLDVVTAWPDLGEAWVHEVPGHYCAPRGDAVAALQSALAACDVEIDGPTVRVHVENKDPIDALVAHSRGAALLVVGSPRSGRSRRAGCATVIDRCQDEAWCPVVVVDGAEVAPSGSAPSRSA
jgi:nucleotide-binding universal stress UspA family protein